VSLLFAAVFGPEECTRLDSPLLSSVIELNLEVAVPPSTSFVLALFSRVVAAVVPPSWLWLFMFLFPEAVALFPPPRG